MSEDLSRILDNLPVLPFDVISFGPEANGS